MEFDKLNNYREQIARQWSPDEEIVALAKETVSGFIQSRYEAPPTIFDQYSTTIDLNLNGNLEVWRSKSYAMKLSLGVGQFLGRDLEQVAINALSQQRYPDFAVIFDVYSGFSELTSAVAIADSAISGTLNDAARVFVEPKIIGDDLDMKLAGIEFLSPYRASFQRLKKLLEDDPSGITLLEEELERISNQKINWADVQIPGWYVFELFLLGAEEGLRTYKTLDAKFRDRLLAE